MIRSLSIFLVIAVFILSGVSQLHAQYTKITGVVIDAATEKPIPFVNVYLEGTSVGATTGFDGQFAIKTKVNADTLLISYIGYKSQKFYIRKGSFQNFIVKLQSSNVELSAVDIHPGENPAHILLRKIIANKDDNSGYKLDAYEYRVYNKVQMDANNITDEFKNRRVFKPFKFIFDNVDTSTINGKSYLPLLLSESVSNYYFRSNPEVKKEFIVASRMSGINNESVAQFLGSMYQKINVYDNYIRVFNKNFASPIANFGLRTYRYYLIDSATIDGHWCYQMMFKPRRKQEATFTGEIWVADTSFAIKRISMKIENVNLNFVNAMAINQEYDLIDNEYWMLRRDNFVVDFNIVENSKKVTGFFAHKTTIHDNIIVNKPYPDDFYRSATTVVVDESAWGKSEEYWDTARSEELNEEEMMIYKTVDTVTNMPIFRTYYDVIAMLVSGYYNVGAIDIGPFYKIYSYNDVEGHRFRIGGRTSNTLSDRYRVYGHLAYGTLDDRYKYGLGFKYIQNKNPRRAVDIYYKNDVEQLGASVNAMSTDNILSSLLRVAPNDKLTLVEEYRIGYEYEWFNGFSNTLTFRHRMVSPLQDQQFEIFSTPGGPPQLYNHITTSEIELNTHFAYRETFFFDKFERNSLGTKYPTINLWYTYGIPDFLDGDFEYHKIRIAMKQRFNILGLGYSNYVVAWGKIFGKLPYNLLEVHPGNETYVYDEFAYNGMNYYEFISDEYGSLAYSHHFQGLFFNHIPLLRKLKWREVIYGNVLVGSMRADNRSYSTFPDVTQSLTEPYYEAGVAVENIFKIIRVDFGWRLSYLKNTKIKPFRIRFNLTMDF
ncbi:MAG: carboxypeptidase-like regulatory domain-containing protein [Bacteroidales bacterium]|nr:carboxypeptidase-like regulatory domain-containing protein [Bacteroidales bacterium]